MRNLNLSATAMRFTLSFGLLCGLVWQAAASRLPELGSRSAASTTFLEEREDKGVCRVHIQETFNDGKKKLNVADIASYSRGECKSEALLRKIASEAKEDIKEVKVYFSYREPAIVVR